MVLPDSHGVSLEKQDSGELYLGDRDVSHLAPQARDYGILFL